MGRRIRWLGLVLLLCFGLVIVQLVNIQFGHGVALRASPNNPKNAARADDNQRGDIYAADGTVLARSVRATSGALTYARQYPGGSLYSQVVGYDSTYEGTAGVEYEYNNQLSVHEQPAQNLSQVLGFDPRQMTTDSVTLTIEPKLQAAARTALSQITGANKAGAVIALDPSTGAVLADYSTPTFDPGPLEAPDTTAGTATQAAAAVADFKTPDPEGFYPGLPLATAETFFPGSTFKVVTTSAVYNLDPALSNFYFKPAASTPLPDTNHPLVNDGGEICGGTIAAMLPQSCDPGYGLLGIALGTPTLTKQADLFGYNARPPVDLPAAWVATPVFPAVSSQATLAYSAIGQESVQASALSNALVAAGVANGGAIMTPHVMAQIRDNQGDVVSTYQPTVWKQAMSASAAATVTALMKTVATVGTADTVGFSPSLDVAVKTGTAQTGNPQADTDDWMIGFAPASHPTIAVAVVVPLQSFSSLGAGVAGPIMKAVLDAALLPQG